MYAVQAPTVYVNQPHLSAVQSERARGRKEKVSIGQGYRESGPTV